MKTINASKTKLSHSIRFAPSSLGAGASTMIGDPPNIIIGSMLDEYVSFVDFIANLMPAIIISSLFCLVYFRWHYKEIFDHPQIEVDYSLLRKKYYITKPVLFAKRCGLSV